MKGEIKDGKTVPFGVKIAIWTSCAALYVTQVSGVFYRLVNAAKDNKNITEVAVLTVDDRKVIDYINKNKFINTKLCKSNLGFGKTKSVEIFNKLRRLNIIRRVGNGSKIRYELINKEI